MSYCRFSDLCYWSDVYVYKTDHGNIVIHVAGNRPVSDVPRPREPRAKPGSRRYYATMLDYSARCDEWFDLAKVVPIGLPFDDRTFYCRDAAEALDMLRGLRWVGYNVPDHATEALEAEVLKGGQNGL